MDTCSICGGTGSMTPGRDGATNAAHPGTCPQCGGYGTRPVPAPIGAKARVARVAGRRISAPVAAAIASLCLLATALGRPVLASASLPFAVTAASASKDTTLVVGEVVSAVTRGDGRKAPVETVVTLSTETSRVAFVMLGGKVGGVELSCENYRPLKVGEKIGVALRSDGSVFRNVRSPEPVGPAVQSVYDYIYQGVRWSYDQIPVPFYVNTAGAPAYAEWSVCQGANIWNGRSPLSFSYAGTTSARGGNGTLDGINSVSWSWMQNDYLALCWYAYGAGGRLVEFDIVFNTKYAWSYAPSSSQFDVIHVAAHELGHAVTLMDMYYSSAAHEIMYGYSSPGYNQRALGDGDNTGLHVAYPGDKGPPVLYCDAQSTYQDIAVVHISASDDSLVRKTGYELVRDGQCVVPWTWSVGASASLNLGPGRYTLKYAAIDDSGNRAEKSVSFEVLAPFKNPRLTLAGDSGPYWPMVWGCVEATLSDDNGPLVGEYVYVERLTADGTWVYDTWGKTESDGVARMWPSRAYTGPTVYRAVTDRVKGCVCPLTSYTVTFYSRADVPAPTVPAYTIKNAYFRVYGVLAPAHPLGTVQARVHLYHYESGAWRYKGYVNAKTYQVGEYDCHYSVGLRLPYTGRWAFRAYHRDAGHMASWSDYSTVLRVY